MVSPLGLLTIQTSHLIGGVGLAATDVAGVLHTLDTVLVWLGCGLAVAAVVFLARQWKAGRALLAEIDERFTPELILVPPLFYILASLALGPAVARVMPPTGAAVVEQTPVSGYAEGDADAESDGGAAEERSGTGQEAAVEGDGDAADDGSAPGGTAGFSPSTVVTNNLAMAVGALAGYWALRRAKPAWKPVVLPRRRGPVGLGGAIGYGIAGAFAAFGVCQGVLVLTTQLIRLGNPDFSPPEHGVILALRMPGVAPWVLPVLTVGVVLLTPLAEEFFFRGLLQRGLGQALPNRWGAMLAAAVVFGCAHSMQPQVIPALTVFGLILGFLYERTDSLLAPIVAHAVFNARTMLWEMLVPGGGGA